MKAKIETADGTVIRVKGSKEEVLDVLLKFAPQYPVYPWYGYHPYVSVPLEPVTYTVPNITSSAVYCPTDPNINEG